MAQSGYEIRLELLKMAKDSLDMEFRSRHDAAIIEYNVQANWAMNNQQPLPDKPTLPAAPTMADITERAKELNEFINQKS